MKRMIAIVLGGALALVGGTTAVLDAATVTTNLTVSATVPTTCTVSATGVNFGNYLGAAITSNGSLSVNCALGTTYLVSLGAGNNYAGGAGSSRRMANSTNFISYGLYLDSALSTEWGDNCPGGVGAQTYPNGTCVGGTGSGVAQALTVFGKTSPGGSSAPGSYSDTVVVSVLF